MTFRETALKSTSGAGNVAAAAAEIQDVRVLKAEGDVLVDMNSVVKVRVAKGRVVDVEPIELVVDDPDKAVVTRLRRSS